MAKNFPCLAILIVSVSILGTSAAAIAKYGRNGITIAHLVLAIFTVFFMVLVYGATLRPGSTGVLACGLLVAICIWLPLLILLFADPGLRPQLDLGEQQRANQSKSLGGSIKIPADGPLAIYDAVSAPISRGVYFGLAFLDCSIVFSALGGLLFLCRCGND